jgi:tripartite-type tricarboxylate transporter receptor subunit TctC
MKLPRRQFLHLAAGAAALLVMPRMAAAQSYPSRPITLIVPYPAGGGADAVARVTAERMRAFLDQSVIIENVGGATGGTGTGRLARAAPDGYTLGIGNWSTQRWSRTCLPLADCGATSVSQIAVSAASTWQKNGRWLLNW